ncbi:MAG: hypothetical protein HY722_13725 [Planctomycetes bacterium]|nr:hypothetical protein [Planctomycetota bacterium]
MSTLAKTLVVIQLVLSAIFLTVAGAFFHHKTDWRRYAEKIQANYREMAQRKNKNIDQLGAQITTMKAYITEKEQEVGLLRTNLIGTGEQLVEKSTQLTQRMLEYQKLLEEHGKLVQQIERQRDNIAELQNANENLRTEYGKARQDKEVAENQVARLISVKGSLERDLEELRTDYARSKQEVEDYKIMEQQLLAAGVDIPRLVQRKPAPFIEAVVMAVKDDIEPGLVLLNVGENQRVQKGYEFTVYRNDEFVAKVIVERVLRDMSGARVLFQKPEANIQVGDKAATRVN